MNIKLCSVLGIVLVIVLDQWSKYYFFSLLDQQLYPHIEITSFLNLVKVYNPGVSFGMFGDLVYGPWILTCVTIMITTALCIWFYRIKETLQIYALGLIIAGAIGNIIDRIRFGAVADFLDFHILGYHWPAFNVADSAIFVGVALVCVSQFVKNKNERT